MSSNDRFTRDALWARGAQLLRLDKGLGALRARTLVALPEGERIPLAEAESSPEATFSAYRRGFAGASADEKNRRRGIEEEEVQMVPTPDPTPVLFAGNDRYAILAAVRALRAAGYAPWLAVNQRGTYAGRSRMKAGSVRVPDPAIDTEGFVREFAAAAGRLSAAAVLPCEETHLLALAGREDDFSGIAFGVPSRESVERATDKSLLPELASAAKLRTPPTTVFRGDGETVGTFGFPAVVKPLRTWIPRQDGTMSHHSVRYVTTEQAAQEAIEDLPGGEGLVQLYISGTNISVSGISWEGELVCTLHHLSERIWPETSGVTAYAKTIPPDVELQEGVGRLLRALDWSGPFELEFRRSPLGEHYLIDLNPRIYGSLALAVAAGLNLPAIWVDLLLGRRPSVVSYRVETCFRQEENDVRALAWMLVNGEFLSVLQGLIPRRHTTHAIFSLRDPMPLLTSALKLAKWPRRLSRKGPKASPKAINGPYYDESPSGQTRT